MGLFRRTPRSPFPADMLRWLETFGRYSFDVQHSGVDGSDLWGRVAALNEYATADREGFLVELQALVATDQGGFATFGASRLVWELYSGDCLRIPAALPLIDAGIDFKLSRGLPNMMLTGYEMDRLSRRRDQSS
jgi:hypothetical protein